MPRLSGDGDTSRFLSRPGGRPSGRPPFNNKARIRSIVKKVAHQAGVEVGRYRPHDARRHARIRHHGVRTVVDVGANRGQYAQELRAGGYRGRIVSFEPMAAAYAQLERACETDPLWECHNLALGADPGLLSLNVASAQASSSLLPMLQDLREAIPGIHYQAAETVRVARLDDLNLALEPPVLLKLDVQGYENRVLAGAQRTLEHVSLVECELSLAPLYDGQAGFAEMIRLLDEAGFSICDLDPFFYDKRDGRVLSVDATFTRRPAGFSVGAPPPAPTG